MGAEEFDCELINDGWDEDVLEDNLELSYDVVSISQLMKKCRLLISLLKRSSLLKQHFERQCKQIQIHSGLNLDVRTRWNSTLRMIESFIKLKSVVSKLFNDKNEIGLSRAIVRKLQTLELSSSDWCTMKILVELLRPFDLATKLLSSQKYPTIGLCAFAIHHIKSFLEETENDNSTVRRLKQSLMKSMIRYIDEETEQLRLIRVRFPSATFVLTSQKREKIDELLPFSFIVILIQWDFPS